MFHVEQTYGVTISIEESCFKSFCQCETQLVTNLFLSQIRYVEEGAVYPLYYNGNTAASPIYIRIGKLIENSLIFIGYKMKLRILMCSHLESLV